MARSINIKGVSMTDRSDMVKRLLAELAKPIHTPMTDNEEKAAFENVEANRERIMNANLRFVFSLAKRFAKSDDVCDYFSSGCIGLSEAIERFDTTKGFKFISFAVHYIRMEMSLLSSGADMVKSSNKAIIGSKVKNYETKFFAENGYYPSDSEIIDYLKAEHGITIKYATEIHGTSMTSLDSKVDDDSDDTTAEIGDMAIKTASINAIEEKIEADNRKQSVSILLNCRAISEVERNVLALWYLKGWNKDKIGAKLGLCGERVRQIQATALKKLKGYAERHKMTA